MYRRHIRYYYIYYEFELESSLYFFILHHHLFITDFITFYIFRIITRCRFQKSQNLFIRKSFWLFCNIILEHNILTILQIYINVFNWFVITYTLDEREFLSCLLKEYNTHLYFVNLNTWIVYTRYVFKLF